MSSRNGSWYRCRSGPVGSGLVISIYCHAPYASRRDNFPPRAATEFSQPQGLDDYTISHGIACQFVFYLARWMKFPVKFPHCASSLHSHFSTQLPSAASLPVSVDSYLGGPVLSIHCHYAILYIFYYHLSFAKVNSLSIWGRKGF